MMRSLKLIKDSLVGIALISFSWILFKELTAFVFFGDSFRECFFFFI